MTKGFFDCGFLLHQLDDGGLRGISAAHAGADHAGVAAVALCIAGSDLLEQLFADIDDATRQTIFQGMQQMELNLNLILEDN